MLKREQPTLLTWHSHRAGDEVLQNALQSLARDHKVNAIKLSIKPYM